jgi:hypothetical protein
MIDRLEVDTAEINLVSSEFQASRARVAAILANVVCTY